MLSGCFYTLLFIDGEVLKMLRILFMFFVCLVFSFLFIRIILLSSEKQFKDREKISPFECGFSPNRKSRNPFSLRFFIVTLIFLIFDIEIALILPLGVLYKINNITLFLNVGFLVIIILTLGLFHEWNEGMLDWVKLNSS